MTELTPDDLQKANGFITKVKETFKTLINKIRIGRLVDFVFKSKQEALDSAPPAEGNWVRLGLEKTWMYFVPLALVLAIFFAKNSLIFFIEIASYGVALIPLVLIGWYLWKRIK